MIREALKIIRDKIWFYDKTLAPITLTEQELLTLSGALERAEALLLLDAATAAQLRAKDAEIIVLNDRLSSMAAERGRACERAETAAQKNVALARKYTSLERGVRIARAERDDAWDKLRDMRDQMREWKRAAEVKP